MSGISIIAKSTPAIMAAAGFIALMGYMNTKETTLLSFANNALSSAAVVVIIIAVLINAPRFIR